MADTGKMTCVTKNVSPSGKQSLGNVLLVAERRRRLNVRVHLPFRLVPGSFFIRPL